MSDEFDNCGCPSHLDQNGVVTVRPVKWECSGSITDLAWCPCPGPEACEYKARPGRKWRIAHTFDELRSAEDRDAHDWAAIAAVARDAALEEAAREVERNPCDYHGGSVATDACEPSRQFAAGAAARIRALKSNP